METERREITVGDLTFDVRVGGPDRGSWVLLLHGFPVNSSCYDDVADRLHESGLRTIQVDQRGYSPGARPEGVEAYRLEALVDDALGVLDALDVPYAILVGHDWGGIVAWHLAGKHPDRFTGLVVASTGHPSAMRDAIKDPDAVDDQREKSAYIKDFIAEGAEEMLLARDGVLLRRAGVTAEELAPLREPGALTAGLNWYRANFTGDVAATSPAHRSKSPPPWCGATATPRSAGRRPRGVAATSTATTGSVNCPASTTGFRRRPRRSWPARSRCARLCSERDAARSGLHRHGAQNSNPSRAFSRTSGMAG